MKEITTIDELETFAGERPFDEVAVFEGYPYKWTHHDGMTVHMLWARDAVVWAREHGFEYASPSPACMGECYDSWQDALLDYMGCQEVFVHHDYDLYDWDEIEEMRRDHMDCRFVVDHDGERSSVSYGIRGLGRERAKEVIYEVLDTAAIEVLDEYGNNVRDEEGLPMYVE